MISAFEVEPHRIQEFSETASQQLESWATLTVQSITPTPSGTFIAIVEGDYRSTLSKLKELSINP